MDKGTRVVHLTSAHPGDDGRIYAKEARSLAAAGYDVRVVAKSAPVKRDERVTSVLLPPVRGRVQRVLLSVPRVLFEALRQKAAVYHFHDPELIPVGLVLKLLGHRVIYDVHENLPLDVLSKDYLPQRSRRAIAWTADVVDRSTSLFADGIVAATPTIAARYPKRKRHLVQNFPFRDELLPAVETPYANRPPLVAYVGAITRIRGLHELVQAMALEPLAPSGEPVQAVLAGDHASTGLADEVARLGVGDRVHLLGAQDRPAVARLLGRARAGIVLFLPEPNHVDAVPTKMFEYMAAGLPVIASNFPLWRKMVADAGAGIVVDPLDPRAVAEAIEWIVANPQAAEEMGRRGREDVITRYNWERESERLLRAYQTILRD